MQKLKNLATEHKFGQNLCEQLLTGLRNTDIEARQLVETKVIAVELALSLVVNNNKYIMISQESLFY